MLILLVCERASCTEMNVCESTLMLNSSLTLMSMDYPDLEASA